MTAALSLGVSHVASAGDALDSVVKCDNVKGGTKKNGVDGNLFTVYVRSEGPTRDAKVDFVTQLAKTGSAKAGETVRFPSNTAKLVNSWMDLNEEKAWFMATLADGTLELEKDDQGNPAGRVVLYLKLKQAPSTDPAVSGVVYMGDVESKKESGVKAYDKGVICTCGTGAARDAQGNMDYSTWKQATCTPNSH